MQQAEAHRQREELLQQELTGARSEAAAAQQQAVRLQHDYDALQADRDQLQQKLTKASASSVRTSAAELAEAASNEVTTMHSQSFLGMRHFVLSTERHLSRGSLTQPPDARSCILRS